MLCCPNDSAVYSLSNSIWIWHVFNLATYVTRQYDLTFTTKDFQYSSNFCFHTHVWKLVSCQSWNSELVLKTYLVKAIVVSAFHSVVSHSRTRAL